MRKAVIAAAVTTGVVAAAARPKKKPAAPPRKRVPKVVVPAQRSGLALIVEDVDELVLADQEARDAQLLDALVGRAS